jgi:hypothetical protein
VESVSVVANLGGARARQVVENGQRWLVAPMTMIRVGVLNGSKGALYYPASEIARNYRAWHGVPLTLDHPTDPITNEHLSAREPGVVQRLGLGEVRNPSVADRSLKAEAWFREDRLRQVAPQVLVSLKRGRPIELSTGLFTNNEPARPGSHHEGKPYTHIARDYRPDHLAVLVNVPGACSLRDGCGILVNQARERIRNLLENANPEGCNQYKACGDKSLAGASAEANEKSHEALMLTKGTKTKNLAPIEEAQRARTSATLAEFSASSGDHVAAETRHRQAASAHELAGEHHETVWLGMRKGGDAHKVAMRAHQEASKLHREIAGLHHDMALDTRQVDNALDKQGGELPAVSRTALKAADFVTLPSGTSGTNCGNCEYVRKSGDGLACHHERLRGQPVTSRNCCALWSAEGTLRTWKTDVVGNVLTVGTDVVGNAYVVNPFVSEAQRRACHAKDDPEWDCNEWSSSTSKDGKHSLPEKKSTTDNDSGWVTKEGGQHVYISASGDFQPDARSAGRDKAAKAQLGKGQAPLRAGHEGYADEKDAHTRALTGGAKWARQRKVDIQKHAEHSLSKGHTSEQFASRFKGGSEADKKVLQGFYRAYRGRKGTPSANAEALEGGRWVMPKQIPASNADYAHDDPEGRWITTEDGNHLWLSGAGALHTSPGGQQLTPEKGPKRGAATSDERGGERLHIPNEGPGGHLAQEASRSASEGPDSERGAGGKSASEPAAQSVPRDIHEVNNRLDRYERFFRARGEHHVADWMRLVKDHVNAVGTEEALKSLGSGPKQSGHGKEEVQYWGVGTEEANWKSMGHFMEAYLARNGIKAVTADASEPGSKLISALAKPDRYLAGDFKPINDAFKDKLDEAKHLPGLEKAEDLGKIVGKPVTHLTPEVTSKLDERFDKGSWIVKSYGDEAAAGYGIFFPQRAAAVQQDARSTIWDAGAHLDKYGFKIARNPDTGKVVGLVHETGDTYKFGSHEYNSTINGDARHWGDRAAAAAENEHGAMLPEGKFMAQPAFKAVGMTDADRAAGKTWDPTNEGRVHLITRSNGSVDVVPHATWLKGGDLPIVGTFAKVRDKEGNSQVLKLKAEDVRGMEEAARSAVVAIPHEARRGQVYAPDVMKTPDGWKVVELNAQGDYNGSGYLHDNHFTIDAYTSHLVGRAPAHVAFIHSLLAKKPTGNRRQGMALREQFFNWLVTNMPPAQVNTYLALAGNAKVIAPPAVANWTGDEEFEDKRGQPCDPDTADEEDDCERVRNSNPEGCNQYKGCGGGGSDDPKMTAGASSQKALVSTIEGHGQYGAKNTPAAAAHARAKEAAITSDMAQDASGAEAKGLHSAAASLHTKAAGLHIKAAEKTKDVSYRPQHYHSANLHLQAAKDHKAAANSITSNATASLWEQAAAFLSGRVPARLSGKSMTANHGDCHCGGECDECKQAMNAGPGYGGAQTPAPLKPRKAVAAGSTAAADSQQEYTDTLASMQPKAPKLPSAAPTGNALWQQAAAFLSGRPVANSNPEGCNQYKDCGGGGSKRPMPQMTKFGEDGVEVPREATDHEQQAWDRISAAKTPAEAGKIKRQITKESDQGKLGVSDGVIDRLHKAHLAHLHETTSAGVTERSAEDARTDRILTTKDSSGRTRGRSYNSAAPTGNALWQQAAAFLSGELVCNAAVHQPRHGESGQYLPLNAGTGKGPVHTAARTGAQRYDDPDAPATLVGRQTSADGRDLVHLGREDDDGDGDIDSLGGVREDDHEDPETYSDEQAAKGQNGGRKVVVKDGTGTVTKGTLNADALFLTYNREWPQERRDNLDDASFAGPNRSFPITNQGDLDAAIASIGRSRHDPRAIEAGIRRIARHRGLTLPPSWAATTNAYPPMLSSSEYPQSAGAAKKAKAWAKPPAPPEDQEQEQELGLPGQPQQQPTQQPQRQPLSPMQNDAGAIMSGSGEQATTAGEPPSDMYGGSASEGDMDEKLGDTSMNSRTMNANPNGCNQHKPCAGGGGTSKASSSAYTASTKAWKSGSDNGHQAAYAAHTKAADAHEAHAKRLYAAGKNAEAEQHLGQAGIHRDIASVHEGRDAMSFPHDHDSVSLNREGQSAMSRQRLIDTLRKKLGLGEQDLGVLNQMTNNALVALMANTQSVSGDPKSSIQAGGEEDDEEGDDGGLDTSPSDSVKDTDMNTRLFGKASSQKGMASNQRRTMDDLLANATQEDQDRWNHVKAIEQRERVQVVNKLTAHLTDPSLRQRRQRQLMARPLGFLYEELKYVPRPTANTMSQMVGGGDGFYGGGSEAALGLPGVTDNSSPMFLGASGGPAHQAPLTENQAGDFLPLPEMSFNEDQGAA